MDTIFAQVLLPLALAFIMLALGVGLTPQDFRRIFSQPKAFLTGAALQFISLPLLAIAIVALIPAPPVLKVGIVLLAACPGGTTSNLLTHMARGDVALSISLTALTSLLSVITVPLVLIIALALFMGPDAPDVGLVTTGLTIFALTVIPVAIGMGLRRIAPGVAALIERRSRLMSGLVFVAVVAATVLSEGIAVTIQRFAEAGLVALALNLAAMTIAFAVSSLMALRMRQRIALTLECGLQNATLAIVVSVALLGDLAYAVPAAVYGLLMFATAGGFIVWARRWSQAARRARRIAG
ncbi:bile acid:sodium symporter family protein [Alkalicaulis satelles]|uniref:Bile acid:sodium symporter family protein n=1 Tax=Alkalicaulis satelles TaxID=2609175 RepID=A0A5M6ZNE5_9PROT|nr:bile acid:sodium symporter [Alkalicaulis satelles]KAA5805435.1 bile acid:sodium symporter family protein [Alkalicaulis satelles]